MLLRKRRAWLWVLTPLLASCATVAPATTEDLVQQRAQARWNALLAGEWSKAYQYMAPSYRALVEEKRFANQFGGGASWVAADVVNVSCEPDRCAVRMKVSYRVAIGGRSAEVSETFFNETWVREEAQWWFFQKV